MSAPDALEQRRKLALLEARLIATAASSTAARNASVARAASMSGSAIASSDVGSSLGSVDSAPPPPPPPRPANPRRNYAPPPPPSRKTPKPAPTPPPPPAPVEAQRSPPSSGDTSNAPKPAAPRPRAPSTTPVPRKRRRTAGTGSSPSTLRNSRVDSYFKPKSRETSKDCAPRTARRSTTPQPPAPPANTVADTAHSSAAAKPSAASAKGPAPAAPATTALVQNAVQRLLSFPYGGGGASAGRARSPGSGGGSSGGEEGGAGGAGGTSGSADEYRRLREMIERLRAENARLGAVEGRVKDLEAENEDLSTQLEIELPLLREQASAAALEHEQSTARLRVLEAALRDAVVAAARMERSEARRRVAAMGDRVGRLGVERSRTSLQEVWEEGAEWKDISRKLRAVQAERDAIDRKRRDLARAKALHQKAEAARVKAAAAAAADSAAGEMPPPPAPGPPAGGAGGAPFAGSAAHIAEQEEIYRVQLHVLKREEAQLCEQRVRLTRERDVLVRELRRQSDEDLSAFNRFPVVHARYVALNLLGRGGFSEVFKGFDLQQGRFVACKIHQLASNWSEEKKRTFIRHSMREYEIHKSLRHPRVVQLIDIFEIDENTFCTVLEYCDGSDLDSYLRTHHTLPEREARSIIGQVVSGLVYLSEQRKRIIHYDLKPGNILLHKGEVRIADFGLSKIMSDGDATADGMELTSQGAGTMWYLPPECFETATQARISSKVDVWSTGVILFQMLYGRKPFGHDQTQEKMFREKTVSRQELKFPAKPPVSDAAKAFITSCLTRKAADRPTVAQLVLHPFLRKR